jgi:hypothetical protein
MIDCGTELARIMRSESNGKPGAAFAPGWNVDERRRDLWRMNAQRERQYSHRGRLSGLPTWARPPRRDGHARDVETGWRTPDHQSGRMARALPARVRCPSCGFIQLLDPSELGVPETLYPLINHTCETPGCPGLVQRGDACPQCGVIDDFIEPPGNLVDWTPSKRKR